MLQLMQWKLPEYVINCFATSGYDTVNAIAIMDVSKILRIWNQNSLSEIGNDGWNQKSEAWNQKSTPGQKCILRQGPQCITTHLTMHLTQCILWQGVVGCIVLEYSSLFVKRHLVQGVLALAQTHDRHFPPALQGQQTVISVAFTTF